MKEIWDFIHRIYQYKIDESKGDEMWDGYIGRSKHIDGMTIVSNDNYYLVSFTNVKGRIIRFKIEVEYSLTEHKSNYILREVYADSNVIMMGTSDRLLDFVKIQLTPIIRGLKLREIGI